jgi:transposase
LPSETLRKEVRQVEANEGRRRDLLTSQEREEIRKPRRENFELRRANEILKAASVVEDHPRSQGNTGQGGLHRGWRVCGERRGKRSRRSG